MRRNLLPSLVAVVLCALACSSSSSEGGDGGAPDGATDGGACTPGDVQRSCGACQIGARVAYMEGGHLCTCDASGSWSCIHEDSCPKVPLFSDPECTTPLADAGADGGDGGETGACVAGGACPTDGATCVTGPACLPCGGGPPGVSLYSIAGGPCTCSAGTWSCLTAHACPTGETFTDPDCTTRYVPADAGSDAEGG